MNGRLASLAMHAARNVLPVPGRAGQEHALGHLAAAQLELLDAAQDADRRLGMLQQVRLAAVVLEPEADLRVVRRDRVLARPGQEPEQDQPNWKMMYVAANDSCSANAGIARRSARRSIWRKPDRAVRGDHRGDDREHDQQPEQVLVPDEGEVGPEGPDAVHLEAHDVAGLGLDDEVDRDAASSVLSRPSMTIAVAVR